MQDQGKSKTKHFLKLSPEYIHIWLSFYVSKVFLVRQLTYSVAFVAVDQSLRMRLTHYGFLTYSAHIYSN